MSRCFWFSKMSLKIFQYNPMTAVTSIFLSETSLQQFGELLKPFPLSSTMMSQNLHTPWLLWSYDSFYFIKRNKKKQSSNINSELYTHERRISLTLRAGLLFSKRNLRVRDFFLSDRRNNEESLKQSIKYYSHSQYLI